MFLGRSFMMLYINLGGLPLQAFLNFELSLVLTRTGIKGWG